MRTHAPHRLGRLFVGLVLTLIACSPEPAPYTPRLYSEDFDGTCAGLPCGWTEVSGAPGAAHTTATLLPGLRGLAVVGDGVVVDGPPGSASPLGYGDYFDAVLLARCDPMASLTVRVALTSTDAPDGAADVAATLLEAHVLPPPAWGTSGTTSDETRQTFATVVPPRESGHSVRVESVTIQKEGPGQCEIDSLAIEQRAVDSLYATDGCI